MQNKFRHSLEMINHKKNNFKINIQFNIKVLFDNQKLSLLGYESAHKNARDVGSSHEFFLTMERML